MLDATVLDVHYLGLELDDAGNAWHVYSDGTRLRLIAGGADDDGDGDEGDGEDDGTGDGDGEDDDDGDEGDDDKTDWKAEAAKWKKLSRKNERAAKQARREADTAKKPPAKKAAPASKSGDEAETPDPEQIREEARKEAQREGLNDRALDRVEAKAGKLFKDPEDARLHLAKNVADFIDGDKIDDDAIKEALDQLLEDKPHLAASKKRFNGDGDGGARKTKEKKATSLQEAVERQLNAGSKT